MRSTCRPFHPEFDRLFAFGIDPPPGQLAADQPSDWPRPAEVERYNQRVRDEFDDRLEQVPEQLLHVAVEHRLMHAETSPTSCTLAYEKQGGTRSGRPAPEVRRPPTAAMRRDSGRRRRGWGATAWRRLRMGQRVSTRTRVDGAGVRHGQVQGDQRRVPGVRARRALRRRSSGSSATASGSISGMFAEIPLPLDWPVYVTSRRGGSLRAMARHATSHGSRSFTARPARPRRRSRQLRFPPLGPDRR